MKVSFDAGSTSGKDSKNGPVALHKIKFRLFRKVTIKFSRSIPGRFQLWGREIASEVKKTAKVWMGFQGRPGGTLSP